VLVQLKKYDRPVSRRFVDEQRGTMLRLGFPQGMSITTSVFARPAIEAAATYPGRPIQLFNGTDLARLLIAKGIGICER